MRRKDKQTTNRRVTLKFVWCWCVCVALACSAFRRRSLGESDCGGGLWARARKAED